jgi:hypothetical protein
MKCVKLHTIGEQLPRSELVISPVQLGCFSASTTETTVPPEVLLFELKRSALGIELRQCAAVRAISPWIKAAPQTALDFVKTPYQDRGFIGDPPRISPSSAVELKGADVELVLVDSARVDRCFIDRTTRNSVWSEWRPCFILSPLSH